MTEDVPTAPRSTGDAQMSVVGYVVAGGIALLLLPVLPFIAVAWVLSRVFGTDDEEPS